MERRCESLTFNNYYPCSGYWCNVMCRAYNKKVENLTTLHPKRKITSYCLFDHVFFLTDNDKTFSMLYLSSRHIVHDAFITI